MSADANTLMTTSCTSVDHQTLTEFHKVIADYEKIELNILNTNLINMLSAQCSVISFFRADEVFL